MPIFEYTPDWSAIHRRISMRIRGNWEPAQKNELASAKLVKKDASKKTQSTLCGFCKKEGHASVTCPERPKKEAAVQPKAPSIYKPSFVLSPTSVKLINVPSNTQRKDLRTVLDTHKILYDMILMIYDKARTEEFKGIVYIDHPTREEAEKCLQAFNRLKMGVQIVSAMIDIERTNRIV